ncbi:MAG: DUF1464 domain-containing protein [Candidatus Lokiarchaeota archaeon]|nr:DUF1464 domain-containing protein [Candidatus Lokiarchaeota archaeon]
MPKVIGIDPGTRSYGIIGLENGNIILDTILKTKSIIEKPEMVIDVLKKIEPIDLIVAPSGLGLPLTRIQDLSDEMIFEMTLETKLSGKLTAVSKIASLMKQNNYFGYFIPGVKHLPTVPKYRKINKIDLGTADKVCSAALAIYDQSIHKKIPYDQTNFILIEMGSGFNAVLAIEDGQIIDGIGGTYIQGPGFLSSGALDGEIAYLMKEFNKRELYQGGVAYIMGYPDISPEEFISQINKDKITKLAYESFLEGILKSVGAIQISLNEPKEILLSGSLSKYDVIVSDLTAKMKKNAPVRKVEGLKNARFSKHAAQGAAIIADGLCEEGIFKELVNVMKIKESEGSVLDNIYISKFRELYENK